jgi:predicted DsbA family dithiol-disulfide isomerase
METVKLTIYSDYVCPWCYVGQGAVQKLSQNYPLEVTWMPFYLRPDTPPEGMELPAQVKAHMKGVQTHLVQMANAAGLRMIFPDRIPNTRLAHEATEYARQKGKANEFHQTVLDYYYGQGEDISRWEVLQQAAKEVGLDADEMREQVEQGKFTALVSEQVRQAAELGIDGVPTYILNDRYAIVGAQPYEVFEQALKQLISEVQQD